MNIDQTFEIIGGVYTGTEHMGGPLDLRRYKDTLTSLGKLKTVGGGIYLEGCTSLNNLGNLETVRGGLDLDGCTSLASLGNLENVGGYLFLRGCTNLTTLGNLETVNNNISSHGNKDVSLKEVQDKIIHYSSLPAHEALNAITSKDVQEVPLYKNILMETLQKV